jgi:hypothetical protein
MWRSRSSDDCARQTKGPTGQYLSPIHLLKARIFMLATRHLSIATVLERV